MNQNLFDREQAIGLVRPYHTLADDVTSQNFAFAVKWLNEEKSRHTPSVSFRRVIAAVNKYTVQRQVGLQDINEHIVNLQEASYAVQEYLDKHKGFRKTTDGAIRVDFMKKLQQLLEMENNLYFKGDH